MKTYPLLRCFIVACAVALTAAPAVQAQAPTAGIDEFFERFTAEWVRGDADLATALRYFSGEEQDRLERQLTPQTQDYSKDRIRLAQKGLNELRKFDHAQLSETQRLSAELMQWQLEAITRAEPYLDYSFPLEQFSGANVQLVETLTLRHPLATRQDADNYLTRLALVDERMNEAVAEAKRLSRKKMVPPRFIVAATLASMRTFGEAAPDRNPLVTAFAQKIATVDSISPAARAELQAKAATLVGQQVYPAWQRAIALLESIRPETTDDAGLWRYSGGEAAYANLYGDRKSVV